MGVGRRRVSWRQIAFQHFAADFVFQAPAGIVKFFPTPSGRRRDSCQTARQLQPGQLRRLAAAGVSSVVRDKLNLPCVRGGLSDHDWERGFGELDKRAPGGTRGEQEFTGYFRRLCFLAPDGLAVADGPAPFGQVDRRQRRRGAAGGKPEESSETENPM